MAALSQSTRRKLSLLQLAQELVLDGRSLLGGSKWREDAPPRGERPLYFSIALPPISALRWPRQQSRHGSLGLVSPLHQQTTGTTAAPPSIPPGKPVRSKNLVQPPGSRRLMRTAFVDPIV